VRGSEAVRVRSGRAARPSAFLAKAAPREGEVRRVLGGEVIMAVGAGDLARFGECPPNSFRGGGGDRLLARCFNGGGGEWCFVTRLVGGGE